MSSYIIHSYQTLNLPTVQDDTDFIIYRHPTSTPGDTLTGIVYSGKIVAGYSLQHLEELLSQYVYTEDLVHTIQHIIQDDEQRFTFYLYTTTDDWDTYQSDTIRVIYDWSYEYDPPYIRTTKSSIPINLMDYRQYAVQSFMSRDGSEESIQVVVGTQTIDNIYIDGESTWTYFRWLNDGLIQWPGEFSKAFSYDFFIYSTQPKEGFSYDIIINGVKYTVANTCYNYCLYYINQWGGYDYMLFAGKEMETDNLSRLSFKKPYVVNSQEFGQVDYQTTINETWSLNTSWMTDIQSDKLKHLFSSNKIWMQDLNDSSKIPHLIPVNITNSTYEHKTWKNQGRKLYSFTIDIKASQTKYRV